MKGGNGVRFRMHCFTTRHNEPVARDIFGKTGGIGTARGAAILSALRTAGDMLDR
jgi:hypothetical protein